MEGFQILLATTLNKAYMWLFRLGRLLILIFCYLIWSRVERKNRRVSVLDFGLCIVNCNPLTFPLPRDRFIVTDISAPRKHSSTGDLLSIELQQVACSCKFIFSIVIWSWIFVKHWAQQRENRECLVLMHSLLLYPACILTWLLRAAICLTLRAQFATLFVLPCRPKAIHCYFKERQMPWPHSRNGAL